MTHATMIIMLTMLHWQSKIYKNYYITLLLVAIQFAMGALASGKGGRD